MSRTIPFLTYDEMEDLARSFLTDKGRAAEPPVDIELLMEKAGLVGLMRRVIIFLSVLSMATSCHIISPKSRQDVTNPLTGDEAAAYQEVVQFVMPLASGMRYKCTGVFVSPRILLTAAHCTVDPDTKEILPYISYMQADGVELRGRPYPWSAFDASKGPEGTRKTDLAIVTFTSDVAPKYARVAAERPRLGDPVRLVGFGPRDIEANIRDGKRHVGTNNIDQIDDNSLLLSGYTKPKPGHAGVFSTPGKGDSGGGLYNAKGELLGIMTLGGKPSAGKPLGADTFVDSYSIDLTHAHSRDFIKATIAEICKAHTP